MDNYYKIFKDDVSEEEPFEEEKEALSSEMKDLLGEDDELDRMLLAASAEAFRLLGSSQNSGNRDGLSTLDIPDDEDEEDEVGGYLAYRFVGGELLRSESTDANESDDAIRSKLVGDSQGKRTTTFEDVIFHD